MLFLVLDLEAHPASAVSIVAAISTQPIADPELIYRAEKKWSMETVVPKRTRRDTAGDHVN